ncbi:D-ribose pyranase [Alpinimonas psychrophila]|uniref:D-ribose pyranase n=1 Tax=Alpinimonas psychrophila TaxID=748908 RepID=A0A7W3JUU8_9MICO|nr:D-ribose pyranase [Alpinimonas psychrophila]MBA8829678.1 D-ribose pyranase [Alpinimonas psychrophila]
MRNNGATLNAQLSRVISEMGHTEKIVVTDAGLPIPAGVERVDLALRAGTPGFLDVLDTVLAELAVEGAIASEEIAQASPDLLAALEDRLISRGVMLQLIPHEEFKKRTVGSRAAVRSGEFTSYANVILIAGVAY